MRPARITIVQFGEDSDDPHQNLEAMKAAVRAHASSDLIVFPELALHGHWVSEAPAAEARRALRGVSEAEIQEFERAVAAAGTRVVYGKVVEREGKLYNIAAFADGHERVSYAKTHVHWTEAFEPGRDFPVARGFLAPLGMLICVDAAYPEVARTLTLNGAEVIVNVSAIPEHFPLKHVHRRVVACSVENQVFTVFANRTGDGFRGGSMVVDPTGEVLAIADMEPSLTTTIDLDAVARWRAEEPVLAHRRPELYNAITTRITDTPK